MEDNLIVDLYWQRNERSISETATKYGKYLHSISYQILQNAEDAEECVNDTYNDAWQSMPPHRPSIGNTDDSIIEEAKKRKKPAVARWTKWVAFAACACLAFGIAISHNSSNVVTDDGYAETVQGYVLETPQEMTVRIVGWDQEGFRVAVTEAEKNTIFPNGAELTITFNEETVFVLSDGSTINFNPENESTPISSIVGWSDGSIVHVEFTAYEDYSKEKHFYNRATGSHLELVE